MSVPSLRSEDTNMSDTTNVNESAVVAVKPEDWPALAKSIVDGAVSNTALDAFRAKLETVANATEEELTAANIPVQFHAEVRKVAVNRLAMIDAGEARIKAATAASTLSVIGEMALKTANGLVTEDAIRAEVNAQIRHAKRATVRRDAAGQSATVFRTAWRYVNDPAGFNGAHPGQSYESLTDANAAAAEHTARHPNRIMYVHTGRIAGNNVTRYATYRGGEKIVEAV